MRDDAGAKAKWLAIKAFNTSEPAAASLAERAAAAEANANTST